MAYRAPPERTPAYLDEFLQIIDFLPTEAHNILAKIYDYDQQLFKIQQDGEDLMKGVMARGHVINHPSAASHLEGKDGKVSKDKVVGTQLAKLSQEDMLAKLQEDYSSYRTQAVEVSSHKQALIDRLYEIVDGLIRTMDKRLEEFEARLRKDKDTTRPPVAPRNIPPSSPRSPTSAAVFAGSPSRVLENNVSSMMASLTTPIRRIPPGGSWPRGNNNIMHVQDDNMEVDPNEPKYCICNRVSYGDMVACENETCPYEWFHFECVGLTSTPKGNWRCSECRRSR